MHAANDKVFGGRTAATHIRLARALKQVCRAFVQESKRRSISYSKSLLHDRPRETGRGQHKRNDFAKRKCQRWRCTATENRFSNDKSKDATNFQEPTDRACDDQEKSFFAKRNSCTKEISRSCPERNHRSCHDNGLNASRPTYSSKRDFTCETPSTRCNPAIRNFAKGTKPRSNSSFAYWFWPIMLFLTLHSSSSYALPRVRKDSSLALQSAIENISGPTALTSHETQTERKVSRSRRQRGIPGFLSKHSSLTRLYSSNYYFLAISNGKVRGRKDRTPHSLVKLESISPGVLAIYFQESRRYLAMNRRGHLYGSKTFGDECKFYEKMAHGRHFYYEAVPAKETAGRSRRRKKPKKHRPRFVGFDKKGKTRRGNKIKITNKGKGALFTKLPESRRRR